MDVWLLGLLHKGLISKLFLHKGLWFEDMSIIIVSFEIPMEVGNHIIYDHLIKTL